MQPPIESPLTEEDVKVRSLSDAELEKAADSGELPPAADPGAQPAKAEGEPTSPAPEAAPGAGTPEPKPAEAEAAPGQPEPEAHKYAGKYSTTEELAKGLAEIAKPLGLSQGAVDAVVKMAEKSGDWQNAENVYLELQKSLRKPAEPQGRKPEEQAPELAAEGEITSDDFKLIVDETNKQIQSEPIVAELRKAGLDIPRTSEEWEAMKKDYPYYATKWNETYTNVFRDLRDTVIRFKAREREAGPHNEKMVESNKQLIRDFAKQYKLKVSDEELAQIIEQGRQHSIPYEERDGVRFLTEDGLHRYFLAYHFPRIAQELQQAERIAGRTEALADLEKNRRVAAGGGISTSNLPTARRDQAGPPKVNPEDESQVRKLTDEQIEDILAGKTPLETTKP